MRLWFPLALLLALPASSDEGGSAASGIDFGQLRSAEFGKAPAAALNDPDRLARAAVDLSQLDRNRLVALGWTERQLLELGPAILSAHRATCALQREHRNNSGDFYRGWRLAGTFANAEGTIRGDLERGCLAHQRATFAAVSRMRSEQLALSKIRYGLFPQHNAVIAYPAGTDWRYTGVVFDGWLRQSCVPSEMTYRYESWGAIRPRKLFGIEIEVEPNPGKAMPRLIGDND